MKTLKRMRYWTMNSWNRSESLAYNLKVYNVVDTELQDKVFELLDMDELWMDINQMVRDFGEEHNYEWQAGFNGRSGGYLVLYRGGIRDGRVYCKPGLNIEDDEVPTQVKKSFRQLAIDIVKYVEHVARNYNVTEQQIMVPRTIKVLQEIGG